MKKELPKLIDLKGSIFHPNVWPTLAQNCTLSYLRPIILTLSWFSLKLTLSRNKLERSSFGPTSVTVFIIGEQGWKTQGWSWPHLLGKTKKNRVANTLAYRTKVRN